MSPRSAAAVTSVAHATIWSFLRKEFGRFPCKLQITTLLAEDHKTRRKNFAQYYRKELRNDAGCLERIVLSDECKFSLYRSLNKQNCRIWGSESPNEVYGALQNSLSVMAWCALSEKEVIETSFFEDGNVTGSRYERMLRYFCFPSFETIQKAWSSYRMVRPWTIFQWSKGMFA